MSRRSARFKGLRSTHTQNVGTQGAANPNRHQAATRVQSSSIATTSPNAYQHQSWPGQNPSGKPIPDLPHVSEQRPLLQSFGSTGTAIFSGIITSEEYNPDFYWRDGIKIYEQMLRNDGQISAIRQMVELPLRRAKWSIEPGSDDPRDVEIASFIETCLFKDMSYQTTEGRLIRQHWDDILRHILMHLWFGFIPFEVIWKVEDGWTKWARWVPLLPRTIWRWWVGEDTELAGIQQWTFKDYTYQFVDIPVEKLLLFVHRQEGNNFEGLPLLRSAYKHWFYKTQFEKIEAVGIERNAILPPVVHLPEGATAQDIAAAQLIGQNMRANELMSVTCPYGWDVEYPKNNQRNAVQVQPSIQYHDVMIARNVLAQFINLGSTETGSYALADTQVQTFLQAYQTVAEYVEDVISNDAIIRLVDYNFDNVEVYPRLKCSKLQADINVIATALKDMSQGQTPLITPNPVLEAWISDQLGIPQAPTDMIQNTNPTAPSTPERPETQPGNHENTQSKDKNGRISDDATAAGGGQDLSEAITEARLLREALEAVDLVARGESFMLYNPAHYPSGSARGGQFAPTGTGGGGGSVRRARAVQTAHTRQLVKAKAETERLRKENEALRAGKGGSKTSSKSGSGEETVKATGKGKSSSQPKQTELPNPIKEISPKSINPYDPHSPEQTSLLHQSYGTAQVGQVLRSFTMPALHEIAGRLSITKPGNTKAKAAEEITKELIRRDGHIGPRTAESTALEHAAKGRATTSTSSKGSTRASKSTPIEEEHFTPLRSASMDMNVAHHASSVALRTAYGDKQFSRMIERDNHAALKSYAKEFGVKAGKTRAETIANIREHMQRVSYRDEAFRYDRPQSQYPHLYNANGTPNYVAYRAINDGAEYNPLAVGF